MSIKNQITRQLFILLLFIIPAISFAQTSQLNAVRFRVTKGFVNKNPAQDNWEGYDVSNGLLVVWDIKNNKVSTYGNEPRDYLITKVLTDDQLKEHGLFVVYMETVDKDNEKVIINLVKYEENGQELYSEMILDYKVLKIKWQLKREANQ